MKTLLICPVCMLLFFMLSCSVSKTTPETISEITKKVESNDFTVKVNYANPMRGRQIYLNSDYDLRIKNDSAFAYLPYFGVAYIAPYGSNEGGIKFAEPVINYTNTPTRKKDGWNIRFRVKSKDITYDVLMNIFNNGNASIDFNSYNRDAISFNGAVK